MAELERERPFVPALLLKWLKWNGPGLGPGDPSGSTACTAGLKPSAHLLLLSQAQWQGVGLEVEQPVLKLAPIWDTGAVGAVPLFAMLQPEPQPQENCFLMLFFLT